MDLSGSGAIGEGLLVWRRKSLRRNDWNWRRSKASLNRFVYLALCKVRGTLLRPDLARSGTQVAPIGLETDHFPSVGIDRQRFLGYRGKRG